MAKASGAKAPANGESTPPAAVPAVKYRARPPGIVLSGIIQQSGQSFASINGRFVKVGQSVEGAKVIKIGPYAVEMELDGERFRLTFGAGPPPPAVSKEKDQKTDEDGSADEEDSDESDG